MSYWDDDHYHADAIDAERRADEEHELAIADHLDDLERDQDRRRRRGMEP